MLRNQILAALKKKYSDLGFSDKAFESLLPYLETVITSEDQIESGVNGIESMLKGMQGEATRWAQAAVDKAPKPTNQPDPNKKEGVQNPSPSDEVPTWFKPFAEKLNQIEVGNSVDKRKQTLTEALKDVSQPVRDSVLKDFSRMNFTDDQDFTTWLEEKKTDVGALEQTVANNSLNQQNRPGIATPQASQQTVNDDIKAWATRGKPADTAKTTA